MSILIRGMEMPTGERPVHIEIHRDGTVIQWKFNESDEIIGTAVDVPTPHGKLIDVDALVEDLERQCKEVFRIDAVSPDDYWITRNKAYNEALWKTWVESFGKYLNTRPTIIEAEEET